MDVNYERLRKAIDETIESLKANKKAPERTRKAKLDVVANLESEISTSEYSFRSDASIDAGGGAKHPRPMDYLLGALLSCQQMWCMRWAALEGHHFARLKIAADAKFTWRGEYLEEVDSGLTAVVVRYDVDGTDLSVDGVLGMADMVARRCPVFATLRKATMIEEEIVLNGSSVSRRVWHPDQSSALKKS